MSERPSDTSGLQSGDPLRGAPEVPGYVTTPPPGAGGPPVATAPAPVAGRTNGKTLGRMATGIRVIRAGGEPMTFSFAMLREVAVKWLAFGIAGSLTFGLAQLADWLWPLWDEENRALHDFVVNTRVIQD